MSDGFSWDKVSSGDFGGKGPHTRNFEIWFLVFAEDLHTWVRSQLAFFLRVPFGSLASRVSKAIQKTN